MAHLPPRSFLRLLNRYLMVPAFRLGLGPVMGNPFTGYIMVVKNVGARTGRARYVPVNYAILDGQVYCLAGFGRVSHWYLNLRAQPGVELILPGGTLAGVAEEVDNPDEQLRAVRQILRNAGFAGFALGFNPHTATDDLLRSKVSGFPVLRFRPVGIGNGPSDPGGWLWILLAVLGAGWILRRGRILRPSVRPGILREQRSEGE
ncbi:MAG: nitroreductase family deazaflavin-dependent oxidoreductase [Chloroflexi bacterium]|nr:nitroreductase family deazaflavin-dependent oxidoreductase [Chloroflexota bacterium]